ncbi:MAG: hypothetical protein VYD54_07345, partial [Bdellovibrionota bacterium]|nr:hypothetical protein [Bdellovibrionota bacterium]
LEALRKENIETPVILISALKLDESIKKGFQSFLQKPVEEQVFLKEVARLIKHQKNIIEPEAHKTTTHEFIIPENISKEEQEIIKEMSESFQLWRASMNVTIIEKEVGVFKGKVVETNLRSLAPYLEKIEESAGKFNIGFIEKLLDDAILKIRRK